LNEGSCKHIGYEGEDSNAHAAPNEAFRHGSGLGFCPLCLPL
jgi:hypothetical protein